MNIPDWLICLNWFTTYGSLGDELDMCHPIWYINSFMPYLYVLYLQFQFGNASKNKYNVPIFIPNFEALQTIMNILYNTKKSVNQSFVC